MIYAVVAEAIALCALSLLVLALVHAYGRLRRAVEVPRTPFDALPRAPQGQGDQVGPNEVDGVTPAGAPVVVPLSPVGHDTLLAFLSSTCTTCASLWATLDDAAGVLPRGVRVLVVAKGPDRESPAELQRLATPHADVVCSSAAWGALEVPGSPYFVLVQGTTGRRLGEGTAATWSKVADLLALSRRDEDHGRRNRGARGLEARVDEELRGAGILPGDPSLYPTTARPTA